MIPSVRVLERISRRAAFGLRLWDIAGATHLADGLEIEVTPRERTGSATRAFPNRSGIYCASGMPGLRPFELGDADDSAAWSAALRPYRVTVRDPQGRFLPFAFDADLPVRGLFDWPGSPPALPGISGSPPMPIIAGVPLFSAASRPAPGTLAAVHAELREFGSERPAAWCLLTVSIDATVCGIGLADDQGRVAVLFPYPERPRPTLASPSPAINDFRWSIELAAYYVPRPPEAPAPAVADLAQVLAQLASPRPLFHSTASPPQTLPAQPLEYRVPLTVRTDVTPSGPSSYLYLNAA